MTEEDLNNSPEYRSARAVWDAYRKRIRDGLQNGVTDDPAVAIARLTQQFGVIVIETALQEYIDNLPSQFEQRWREYIETTAREREEASRRARNPKGAGRKHKRSDDVLMAAWLIVQRCTRIKRLNVRDSCKQLVKPPSRRQASQWPGLLLYRDHTKAKAHSYYVTTPGNLRDVYNDAVTRYQTGPEGLRLRWQSLLEIMAPVRAGNSSSS